MTHAGAQLARSSGQSNAVASMLKTEQEQLRRPGLQVPCSCSTLALLQMGCNAVNLLSHTRVEGKKRKHYTLQH